MKPTIIYTKTPKGIRELASKARSLSRDAVNVLLLVDGKSTVAELHSRSNLSSGDFDAVLIGLASQGFVRVLAGEAERELEGYSAQIIVSEVEPEEFLKAQAEAEARAKAKKAGFKEDARRKQEEERVKAEADAKAQAEAQARAEAEVRAQEEAEARARAEAQARAEAKARADAEVKARAEMEAKAKAEAKAREAAEARARAEAQARQEAEARARQEAAARQEAEARAQAEARAKVEAEARARAEAQARQEVETQARIEAQKRQEAEARAWEEAREKAEMEAQARAEAEARAKSEQEAAAKARLEAEGRAREEAEARVRVEAEARIAAEARAREESQAREAAEAKARAEVKAREEAEARVREEAKAREVAESRVMEEARARERAEAVAREESQARAAAEAQANAEAREKEAAEARIRREAAAREAAEAEAMREARAKADAEERARAEAEAWEAAEARARAATEALKAARVKLKGLLVKPVKGVKFLAAAAVALVVLGIGLLQLVPLNFFIPQIEKTATEIIREPVSITAVRVALFPSPHLTLEGVAIGGAQDIKLGAVVITPALTSLLAQTKELKLVRFESVALDQDALIGVAMWSKPNPSVHRTVRVNRAELKDVALTLKGGVVLPSFGADIALAEDGAVREARLDTADGKLQMQLGAAGQDFRMTVSAKNWGLPMGPPVQFDDLHATGTLNRDGLVLSELAGDFYQGTLKGSARLAWGEKWRLEGEFDMVRVGLDNLLPLFTQAISLTGKLDAHGRFAMEGPTADKLFSAPQVAANFIVRDGVLGNVDLMRAIQSSAGGALTGGRTQFGVFSGNLALAAKRYQFRQMQLAAGPLGSSGFADIAANGMVSGEATAEFRSRAGFAPAHLVFSGKLGELSLRRVN